MAIPTNDPPIIRKMWEYLGRARPSRLPTWKELLARLSEDPQQKGPEWDLYAWICLSFEAGREFQQKHQGLMLGPVSTKQLERYLTNKS